MANGKQTKKYLEKLRAFFDADYNQKLEQIDSVKQILDKLKKTKQKLREKIADEQDAKQRKNLEEEFKVVQKQRKKGVQVLKELQKNLKEK